MSSNSKTQKPGCLSAFLSFFRRTPPQAIELPYRVRDDFLSPAELSFYKALSMAIGDRAVIFPKVRLADLFFVSRPNENRKFYNSISSKHIDFVLCDPINMKPSVGCELDDASHKRMDRQERDKFVDQVFEVAGLPLIRIPVREAYQLSEMRAKFAPFIGGEELTSSLTYSAVAEPGKAASAGPLSPTCPKCGIPMVVRTVSKGEHQGKQFYGCQNYPKCREVKAL